MAEPTQISDPLQKLKDSISTEVFGMTVKEATDQGICISCRRPALERCYSDDGKLEYPISGLCELCFDKFTK